MKLSKLRKLFTKAESATSRDQARKILKKLRKYEIEDALENDSQYNSLKG